ncbi:hypothetical protein B0H14DRAFT_2330661, partial [Mycena olivaceomarginata]
IPHPRNAFIIFKSEFNASGIISKKVENDHRRINIIAATIWNALSDEKKEPYRVRADYEKIQHHRMYPNYRFTPTVHTTKRLKCNMHRNGAKDVERSHQIPDCTVHS